MKKLEIDENFYRKLYISTDELADIAMMGDQGVLINDMLKYNDVKKAIECLNIISMNEKMYPELPFLPLSYCDLSDIKCVIIGGTPDPTILKNWTGSAYSYDIKNYKSLLHSKIIHDIVGKLGAPDKIEGDFYKLQSKGVLMLHEMMCASAESFNQCRDLWYPIIHRLLNYISRTDANIPIVFTNIMAQKIFGPSIIDSFNVFNLRLTDIKDLSSVPEQFEMIEYTTNIKIKKEDRIDFIKLIEK